MRVDLEGIDQRILALDVPARAYAGLAAGASVSASSSNCSARSGASPA